MTMLQPRVEHLDHRPGLNFKKAKPEAHRKQKKLL